MLVKSLNIFEQSSVYFRISDFSNRFSSSFSSLCTILSHNDIKMQGLQKRHIVSENLSLKVQLIFPLIFHLMIQKVFHLMFQKKSFI
jgi:hypothetical protein